MKKDTRRDLGKRLANREAEHWVEGGWVEESNIRTVWLWSRNHMVKKSVTVSDYFNRYDRIFAWPSRGVTVYVQISAQHPSSGHEAGPLGFPHPDWLKPDTLVKAPLNGVQIPSGSYELFVWYRKLKGLGWVPDRRWWEKKAEEVIIPYDHDPKAKFPDSG